MAEEVRIAAFFDDDRQRQIAEEVLGDAEAFNNVVEGAVAVDRIDDLIAAGLIVEPLDVAAAPEAAPPAGPDPAAVEELAALADQLPERPTMEQALPEDVYHIHLSGPITREQRLEFDSFGVDIAAFEPPDRYRSFLTPEQYGRVGQLPYVVDVTRYGLEESVTKELVDEIKAAQRPAAGFASAAGSEPRQEFDCMVHRERDLPEIRSLIENTEGAQVLGTSNLRIRFEAPVSAPMLAALAALPEVNKLAPFTPPML